MLIITFATILSKFWEKEEIEEYLCNEITKRKTKNVKFKRVALKFKKNYLKNL